VGRRCRAAADEGASPRATAVTTPHPALRATFSRGEKGSDRLRFRPRAGITLTEILIAIFIMGIGLVSLATLFPIGLLRLREAQRQSRSAYLVESAAADAAARGLFRRDSFAFADLLNFQYNLQVWYPNINNPLLPNGYNPLIQDAGFFGGSAYGAFIPYNPNAPNINQGLDVILRPGGAGYQGLPFAYDPLWRYQTVWNGQQGVYLDPSGNSGTPEARFGAGIGFLRLENFDGQPAPAHGLQRLTNFNVQTVMPSSTSVPGIFVSPEDIVWQETTNTNSTYTLNGVAGGITVLNPSGIVPDLNTGGGALSYDWRYSWMITARQNNASTASSFDGNIVIFENRPFAIDQFATPTGTTFKVAGETVVEGVFGYGTRVFPATPGGPGYAGGADRTVLLRWISDPTNPTNPPSQPDPVVKVGDWIADVTYERSQELVFRRFYSNPNVNPPIGFPNPLNRINLTDPGQWDNLPAQRCFWYQVQKVLPAGPDPQLGNPYRSMVVYVNRKLEARTLLNSIGLPWIQNAALVSPHVVNVIPQTFFVR
jgi:type II secretory pathway pseudopilin PulG